MIAHSHTDIEEELAELSAKVLSAQPTPALMRMMGKVSVALMLRLGHTLAIAKSRYVTRDELRELDARTLRDVGLTKEQVDSEATKWIWRG